MTIKLWSLFFFHVIFFTPGPTRPEISILYDLKLSVCKIQCIAASGCGKKTTNSLVEQVYEPGPSLKMYCLKIFSPLM